VLSKSEAAHVSYQLGLPPDRAINPCFLGVLWHNLGAHYGGAFVVEAAWDFLSNPENRAILGWVGGGIVVVLGAIWTVFKYFYGGSRVSAQDGSFAAGRDIKVGGNIHSRSEKSRHQ
jgi:hypothetical protein